MVLAALVLGQAAGAAQEKAAPTRDAFLEGAAAAAELYAERSEALADGFRRLGPDFPGMGEHWIQTGRIVAGELRADRPPVLCYVEIGGRPTLVGLAYTLPLSADELPPAEPFPMEAWHDHSGEVSEESLLLSHPSSVIASDTGFRLSMLHVWLPLDNPGGMLAQNNWRLPFLRAGIEPPREVTSQAARGLSLGSRGVAYYRELLHWGSPDGSPDRESIDRILGRLGAEVSAWIDGHRGEVSQADAARLEAFWHTLWDDLARELSPETFARIRPLQGDVH
jgi:hypothetical protein